MAIIDIIFTFSDDTTLCHHFEATEGLGGDIADYAKDQAVERAEDCDGNEIEVTCTGWEILDVETDYESQADPDDFETLDDWAEYCDQVQDNGEGYCLRYEDIGENNFSEEYRGCWSSEEEFAHDLLESCYTLDDPLSSYFDYEKWTRDVMMDYDSYMGEDGFHIFRK